MPRVVLKTNLEKSCLTHPFVDGLVGKIADMFEARSSRVAVTIEPDLYVRFADDPDVPRIHLDVHIIGLNLGKIPLYSREITDYLTHRLHVPAPNIMIWFYKSEPDMVSLGGQTVAEVRRQREATN